MHGEPKITFARTYLLHFMSSTAWKVQSQLLARDCHEQAAALVKDAFFERLRLLHFGIDLPRTFVNNALMS